MRLIDADAFKEYIAKGYEEYKGEFKTDKYRNVAKEATKGFIKDIDEQPTVYVMDKNVKEAWRERKEITVGNQVYVDKELLLDRLTMRFEDEKKNVRKEENTPNIEDIITGIEICVQLLRGYY